MRRALFVFAIAATLSGPVAAGPLDSSTVYVTVDDDAVATALGVVSHDAVAIQAETGGGVALLPAHAGDLEALSEAMHAEHHRCGGFMVHDTLAEARAELVAPMSTDSADTDVDYRLDRGDAVRAMLPRLDRERIRDTIAKLAANKNRYWQSESGAATPYWLRDLWRTFTTRTDVTIELFDHGYPQKSVIMTVPGTTRPAEVVVIGGHLDSIAPGGTRSSAPGADDDASGIATLTEVARVLLANDFRPERTVQFIGYAAEEVGLRGSLSISKAYKKRGVKVVGVLQLDMTNYQGSDRDIWLIDDFTSAKQNKFLVDLIETYVGATWGVDRCGYACSDHAAWHRAGYRASMPFEARFRDMNQKIHTPKDTLETSDANAAHAVKFARLATAYAIELGKSTTPAVATMHRSPPAGGGRCTCGHRSDGGRWPLVWLNLGVAGLAWLLARRVSR